MLKHFFLISILCGISFLPALAQSRTKTFTTKFIPNHVTYNGSDNPNECWESVAWGILIEEGENVYFFSMSYRDVEASKEKIGDAEVIIEVGFYDEPYSDSGEDGWVKKITLNGVIILGE